MLLRLRAEVAEAEATLPGFHAILRRRNHCGRLRRNYHLSKEGDVLVRADGGHHTGWKSDAATGRLLI